MLVGQASGVPVVVGRDGGVWDVSLRRELCQLSSSSLMSSSSLHDGRHVMLVRVGSLFVSDVLSGRECCRFGVDDDACCVSVIGGGRELLSGHDDGMLRRWDVETGCELSRRRVGDSGVKSLCSLSSGHVVVGFDFGSYRVLDVASLGKSFSHEMPMRMGSVAEVLK